MVAEYPSSSLGDEALYSVVQMAREDGDRRRITEAVNAYLDACPDGPHAPEVKALLRKRAPAAPVPSPPPPGLARVFDLRSWTGDSSTRVVIDLERKVSLASDRIADPDRLWIDLAGTRLHPNLKARSFPVSDGLLEQIRIAQNRDDVVRVVLDFKDVKEHSVFFLENPTRLIIDVKGTALPGPVVAQKDPPPVEAAPDVDALPTRRMNGMLPADGRTAALPPQPPPTPIALGPFEPARLERASARHGDRAPPQHAPHGPRASRGQPRRHLQPRPPARAGRPPHRHRRRPRRPRPRDHRRERASRRRTSSSTSPCASSAWCDPSSAPRS